MFVKEWNGMEWNGAGAGENDWRAVDIRWWLRSFLALFGKLDWLHCFGSLVDLFPGSVSLVGLVLLWWSNMLKFDVS
jgi:hypothetical protein